MKFCPIAFRTISLHFMTLLFVMVWLLSHVCFANSQDLISEGDQALAQGDLDSAEKIFEKAVKLNPEGYRAMKALAEIKSDLKKYEEANALIERILDLKVTGGRKVLVYRDDGTDPKKGELVDEKVVKMGVSQAADSKFLKTPGMVAIEYYRIFLVDSGKVELLPKSQTQIRYFGIPRIIRERVVELHEMVKKKLIASAGAGKKEEMVEIKGGCFMMGSEKGNANEMPVHEVCVSPFKMDAFEITQRNFQFVINLNPSHFQGAELPVDSVTWMDANDYCRKVGKRLPTEAEWEYAARAGASTEYYWGEHYDPKMGNLCDSSCELNVRSKEISDGFKHTAPVGSFPSSPFGLHDMAGNVSEWVWDSYHETYYLMSPKNDPKGYIPNQKIAVKKGPEDLFLAERSASRKIVRGGAWENHYSAGRSASRKVFYPGYRFEGVGFRCAADL